MGCYFSPAKLNLFFRVLYRREDGFHEIASLFQAIDLGDTLDVETSDEDAITCSDPALPCDETNLVVKARNLFRLRTGLHAFRVRCRLDKKIPMEAGLGGGSSNAATMLYACNELAGRPASLEQLTAWGAELGSDVAFFFSSGSAYCTGKGEKLLDQSLLENAATSSFLIPGKTWIAKPYFGVSTPRVYQACRPDTYENRDPLAMLAAFHKGVPVFFNDLEQAAFSVCSPLRDAKKILQAAGFSTVVMTGSGSAFLCMGLSRVPQVDGFFFVPVHAHHRPLHSQTQEWYSFPSPCYR